VHLDAQCGADGPRRLFSVVTIGPGRLPFANRMCADSGSGGGLCSGTRHNKPNPVSSPAPVQGRLPEPSVRTPIKKRWRGHWAIISWRTFTSSFRVLYAFGFLMSRRLDRADVSLKVPYLDWAEAGWAWHIEARLWKTYSWERLSGPWE